MYKEQVELFFEASGTVREKNLENKNGSVFLLFNG